MVESGKSCRTLEEIDLKWIRSVVHIYNGILAIKRNETELFVVRWMDLETVIQRSKSEREKQIPYANTYIWNKKKKKIMKNLGTERE